MNTLMNPRTRLVLSLLVAGIGMCLFFSGIYRNFEIPMGFVGTVLFSAAVWSAVTAIHTTPTSDAEQRIAPGEWKAWVDLGFLVAILAAMALALTVPHTVVPIGQDPDAQRFGRLLTAIFIAWAIVSYMLRKRWGAQVTHDERDAQIDLNTTKLSLYMMVCGMFAFVILLTANPLERLQWLSYGLIAHILIMIMVTAHLIGNIAQIVYYARERVAADA